MADGTRNMTVGSPAGHLIRFALPLLAGSFLQQLYNMVDSFVVGRYVGDAALAAVGVGFPVLFMFTSLFTGLSNGGTVVIAQLYGAGELQRVRDAVDTIYTAFLLSVLPVTLAAVALVKPLLVVLRVDASVWQDACSISPWCARDSSAPSATISTPAFWAALATAAPRCCFCPSRPF